MRYYALKCHCTLIRSVHLWVFFFFFCFVLFFLDSSLLKAKFVYRLEFRGIQYFCVGLAAYL